MEETRNQIPLLTASEIECRVGSSNEKGCTLLLYKDARVDMAILDTVYGPLNWRRSHQEINGNLYCTIEVWDETKHEWVSKQDVGVESYSEKEKGQASDSFKRAGVNWGIGRELYTGPTIWVNLEPSDKNRTGKISTKFSVKEIEYTDDRKIKYVVIVDNKGAIRFSNKPDTTAANLRYGSQEPSRAFIEKTLKRISASGTTTELNAIYYELKNENPQLVKNGTELYNAIAEQSNRIKRGEVA